MRWSRNVFVVAKNMVNMNTEVSNNIIRHMLNLLFKDRNRGRLGKLPKTPLNAQNLRHIKIKQQTVLTVLTLLAIYFQEVLMDLSK